MLRSCLALAAAVLSATAVMAQPGRLPLSPGVVPSAPYRTPPPPMVVRPGQTIFVPNAPNLQLWPLMAPWGYPVAPGYGALYGGFGYGYPAGGLNISPPVVVNQSVTNVNITNGPVVVPTREFPATLTVQLPRAAEVWLNGKKVSDEATEEHVLSSPVLKPGEQFTFEVKARWTTGGKTYEAKRTVTLDSGARSRLTVISGTEVS